MSGRILPLFSFWEVKYLKSLNEVSRKNLVGKSKVFSPERYNKRLRYSTMSTPEINEDELLNEDILTVYVRVGSYICTLSFSGVVERLKDIVYKDSNHAVNRRNVIRALNEQVDLTDVYVRCQCGDFKYRFAYLGWKFDYLYGEPETRPANITNPHNDKGAVCKHLLCILSNKKWLVKASSVVNDFIHEYYDDIVSRFDIDPYLFRINIQAYTAASIGAAQQAIVKPPAELLGMASILYDPNELEDKLYNTVGKRGWEIRIDTDLDKPVTVYLSKSLGALDNPYESDEPVYIYDVMPAGSKIRLQLNKEEQH